MKLTGYWDYLKSEDEEFKFYRKDFAKKAAIIGTLVCIVGGLLHFYNLQQEEFRAQNEKRKNLAAIKEQVSQKENEWKTLMLNIGSAPIPKTEVAQIQNNIIQHMQQLGVDVQGITTVNTPPAPKVAPAGPGGAQAGKEAAAAPPPGVEYEAVIVGSWDNVRKVLIDLPKSSSFINIKLLRMEPQAPTQTPQAAAPGVTNAAAQKIEGPPQIKATFRYKIYTE